MAVSFQCMTKSTTNKKKKKQRHILIESVKIKYKERILKAAREKNQVTYNETPIRLSDNFSAEIL